VNASLDQLRANNGRDKSSFEHNAMAEPRLTFDVEATLKQCDHVIKGILRDKLRVTLSDTDGRIENEDALDLYGEVVLAVVEELHKLNTTTTPRALADPCAFIAVITYHRCADYLRWKYRRRHSLKNKLRYFLSHRQGFAVWEGDREILCGFASWPTRRQQTARAEQLDRVRAAPEAFTRFAGRDLHSFNADDWERLLDAIFNASQSPVELDDLVNLVAEIIGVQDEAAQVRSRVSDDDDERPDYDPPATELTPEEVAWLRQFLRRLWSEVNALRPLHRMAYLLNFTDAEGDVDVFVRNQIVTRNEIGRALNLTVEQFTIMWSELELDTHTRAGASELATDDERFAFAWLHLPLFDSIIAKVINGKRQQVINLRNGAHDKLVRQMKPFFQLKIKN
jgi:DNA-directed RNA polymerase specialized sigma24 family protein